MKQEELPKDYVIQNALIENISLNDGGRDLLTASIGMDYGDGGHQGFGGYSLYLPDSFKHHETKSYAGHFIYRCMQICEVDSWDKIKGKSVRVVREKGFQGLIKGIGHITKDDFFLPEIDFK